MQETDLSKLQETDIIEMMERLFSYIEEAAHLEVQGQDAQRACMPSEVLEQYDLIGREYYQKVSELRSMAGELTAAIKEETLRFGRTVKSEHYMATWCKGKTRWDTSKLSGYALAHPEINALMLVDGPTVTIKAR